MSLIFWALIFSHLVAVTAIKIPVLGLGVRRLGGEVTGNRFSFKSDLKTILQAILVKEASFRLSLYLYSKYQFEDLLI